MNQSIISRGKTVNEAVTVGLELLNASKQDVDIEVLKFETKGILGLGKKKAVIKLTMRGLTGVLSHEESLHDFEAELEDVATYEDSEQVTRGNSIRAIENQLSGKAWVKDGEIYSQPSSTRYPTVTMEKGIKLYKNDVLVQKTPIVFTDRDQLLAAMEMETRETKWKVTVEEGYLKAVVKVEPGYVLTRTLNDTEPADELKLTVTEHLKIQNTLTYDDIMNRLRDLRVTYGINQADILQAVNTTEPGEYVIAMGKQATNGENGWIENRVDLEMKEGPVNREDGSVNFREIKSAPNCSNGQVIAVIHAPQPGKPGVKITNEPIPPQQMVPIKLHDCKGIMPIENGTEIHVVATESGRPFIQTRGQLVKIAIMPKLVCKGNVDLEHGNIRFHGDVEIMGNINENMEVEAKGNVTVHQNIYKASINTTGTILTNGNIIGSDLSAGKSNLLIAEMGYSLKVINQQIKSLISVIQELMKSPAFKSSDIGKRGLQPLIFILLERKFKNLIPLIKKHISIIESNEKHLEYEWKEASLILKECFLSINNELLKLERLQYLVKKLDSLIEISETPVEPNAFIVIPYVMNSKVYCSGNITITGQGCYRSKVHSGGILKINGAIRGGEVYGRLGVEINETGSESGVNTLIAVPVNQKIAIKQVKEGTIIKIGNFKHIFDGDMSDVNARVVDDRLIL